MREETSWPSRLDSLERQAGAFKEKDMSWTSNLDLLRTSGEDVRIVPTGRGKEARIVDSMGNPITALPSSSTRAALMVCKTWGLRVAESSPAVSKTIQKAG
jgi:hypothetical protein